MIAMPTFSQYDQNPAPPAVVHYAPYGRNAIGEFCCGAKVGGYTDIMSRVTCDGCKRESPGLWPAAAASVAYFCHDCGGELTHERLRGYVCPRGCQR